MNLRDCRTLDELEQFVNAKYVYGIDCYNEVIKIYPKLAGISFEVDKSLVKFKLHISGAMTTLYDVYTTLKEANQAAYNAKMEALKDQRNGLIEERNRINKKIKELEEKMRR